MLKTVIISGLGTSSESLTPCYLVMVTCLKYAVPIRTISSVQLSILIAFISREVMHTNCNNDVASRLLLCLYDSVYL